MPTTYSQTNTDDTYGTQSNKFWGAKYTDSEFHSKQVNSVTYYFRKETAGSESVTISLASLNSSGDVQTLALDSQTITVTNPSFTEATFTPTNADGSAYTFPADGGYLMCYAMDSLATNVEFAVTPNPDPTSSTLVTVSKKLDNSSSVVDFSDYPKVSITYQGSVSGGTHFPPPPLVVRF